MKIGEIADKLDTNITTLRFYENKGLIRPHRSQKGTRIYTEEDLKRFRAILNLASLDIPLEAIQRLTQIRSENSTGNAASHAVEAELYELEEVLTTKLKQLKHCVSDIKQARERLTACHGCRKRPLRHICSHCPDSLPLLDTDAMHIVWDQE